METKPIYTSKTIIGALVLVLAVALERTGIPVLEGEVADLVNGLVALIGLTLTVYGRVKAKKALTVK